VRQIKNAAFAGKKTTQGRKEVKNNRSTLRCLAKGKAFSLSIFR